MVPVVPSRMVWRVLRCPRERGISSLCYSRAFSARWIGKESTQHSISIRYISRLFGCISLSFIARGYGLAAPFARLSQATLLALFADLVQYVFVGVCLGRGYWVGLTMVASGLLTFRRCCTFILEGKSQVGVIPICVSSEWHVMPCCIIAARLPTSARASRHTSYVPC